MREYENKTRSTAGNMFYSLLYGVLFGSVVGILIALILSFIANKAPNNQFFMDYNGMIAFIIGIGVCSLVSAKLFTKQGLLTGVISGVVYTILMSILGFFTSSNMPSFKSFITYLLIAVIVGAICGILAMNTRKRKR